MLTIVIPGQELFNNETQKFIETEETTLHLEHSLVSLSKWESIWGIAFLGNPDITTEQTYSYIRCMTLGDEIPPEDFYKTLPASSLDEINKYMSAKMTATWFNETPGAPKSNKEVITSEVIYYWLVALQIPFEVQNWHLNRLLTLVRVTNIKNEPNKKMMPKTDAAAQQRRLNAERRARMNSKG